MTRAAKEHAAIDIARLAFVFASGSDYRACLATQRRAVAIDFFATFVILEAFHPLVIDADVVFNSETIIGFHDAEVSARFRTVARFAQPFIVAVSINAILVAKFVFAITAFRSKGVAYRNRASIHSWFAILDIQRPVSLITHKFLTCFAIKCKSFFYTTKTATRPIIIAFNIGDVLADFIAHAVLSPLAAFALVMAIEDAFFKASFAVFKFALGAEFIVIRRLDFPRFTVANVNGTTSAIGNFLDAIRLAETVATATHPRLAFIRFDIQASHRLPIVVLAFIVRTCHAVNGGATVLIHAVTLFGHAIVIRDVSASFHGFLFAANRLLSPNSVTVSRPMTIRTRFNGTRAQWLLRKRRTAHAEVGLAHFTKLFDGVTTLRKQCSTLRAERDIG